MVHDDVAIAARAMHVYWRARVLCATAEPHRRPDDGICDRHYEESRRQLSAAAPASDTGLPASGTGAGGVADRVWSLVGDSTSEQA